jgi:predicted DNA-binding transcriptional regulator YafY
VSISYDSRSREVRKTLVVNPLALVQRGLITYLVATATPHTDVRLYALHRVRTARLLDEQCARPRAFDLDAFLQAGFGDFGQGRRIKVRLRVSASVATHLTECRLSEDQVVTSPRNAAGWWRVTATVNDTPQFRWWVRGFGADMQMERPRLR